MSRRAEAKPRVDVGICDRHGAYRRMRVPPGTLRQFGLEYIGSCPECGAEREAREIARERTQRISELRAECHIPLRFAEKSFASYMPGTLRQQSALRKCEEYAVNLEHISKGRSLVMIGPPGVGKTHLLCAIGRALIEALVPVRYGPLPDVMAAVRGNWSWHGAEHGDQFISPTVLLLDELWIPSPNAREAACALLDARYSRRKPTLIGSNLSWPEIKQQYGERFADRLLEGGGDVIPLDGSSYRSTSK